MKVAVVLFGPLRRHLPDGTIGNRADVEVADGSSVLEVARSLDISEKALHAVLVEGTQTDVSTRLEDGQELVLMPPFSGGAGTAAVLTVSDSVDGGSRQDESGDLAEKLLVAAGFEAPERVVSSDDADLIEKELRRLVKEGVALIVSTGGTGFAPRDVTPEATKRVIDREAPGLAELMRSAGLAHTPHAALSRGVAGIAEQTLLVNLPGSPRAVKESLEAILPVLDHALALVRGHSEHHGSG